MTKPPGWRRTRASCAILLALSVLAPLPILEAVSAAAAGALKIISGGAIKMADAGGQEPDGHSPPSRVLAQRLKITERGRRELLFDEAVVSATVMDPEIILAEVASERLVTLTGLRVGETILIISGRNVRRTYSVNVSRPARAAQRTLLEARGQAKPESFTGFYSLYYAPRLEDGSSALRHRFEFRHQLPGGRAVRSSGEVFKFFGGGVPGLSGVAGAGLGASRLTLGVDAKDFRLDVLDSELEFSQPGFAGLTMRGPHLVSNPGSKLRGLELFVGILRPSSALFGSGEGRIAGALMPVASGTAWRWRAGVFALGGSGLTSGGMVWQTDARYAPDERTLLEGEASYSGGDLSWRARLDLRRGGFRVLGETSRLAERSPLAAFGAQAGGGHNFHSLGFGWQPAQRLSLFANYSRAKSASPSLSRRVGLDSSTLQASLNYRATRNSSFYFNFTQQALENSASSFDYTLQLRTRTLTLRHNARFGSHWASDFEARLISSREADAGAHMNRGVSIREQLRYNGRGWSFAAYAKYSSNTPSLESLVLRNPALLPPALRPAFESDPARFLATNRDALPALLDGVELPLTRSMEAGARLRAAFSRYRLTGEARFVSGEILARERRQLLTNFGVDVRLDNANSVQVSAGRSFAFDATRSQSALTFSFTHRFGAGGGGSGFGLSKLLGMDRGQIQGRAFFDLDGDGHDDPEEPGVADMKIQLDGGRTTTTDALGRYRFTSLVPGEYTVALQSEQLGVRLRSSAATEKRVSLSPRQTSSVSFGLMNFGLISGRVYSDLFLAGPGGDSANAPGVKGVRLTLRPVSADAGRPAQVESLDPGGSYMFDRLAPGAYLLTIDPMTIPPDFSPPAQLSWTVTISPLQGFYLDIPLVAQRAVSGIVFIDRDGDGQLDPSKDEGVVGAVVTDGRSEVRTGSGGSYLLRNLPAGRVELRASSPWGRESRPLAIDLGAEPGTMRGIHLLVPAH